LLTDFPCLSAECPEIQCPCSGEILNRCDNDLLDSDLNLLESQYQDCVGFYDGTIETLLGSLVAAGIIAAYVCVVFTTGVAAPACLGLLNIKKAISLIIAAGLAGAGLKAWYDAGIRCCKRGLENGYNNIIRAYCGCDPNPNGVGKLPDDCWPVPLP
jgi:hypothetical protein